MIERADVVIIGGGAVGCLIARALSRYKLETIIIEKEADLCCGASKANSAIVHAGYDPHPGSLKARLNVSGNALFEQVCRELSVPFKRTGSLAVAFDEEEVKALRQLKERGERNGVPGLRIVGREELKELEPNLNPRAQAALYAPTAGTVDPFLLTIAAAENAVLNGAKVWLETEALDFLLSSGMVRGVVTTQGTIEASFVINAAGLGADLLAKRAGLDPSLFPRRGEYYLLDKETFPPLNHVLFPVPTPVSKGITVVPTVHGNLLLGPNAQCIPDREDKSTTEEGLAEVYEAAKRLVPEVSLRGAIANFAGLRAASHVGDFVIEASRQPFGLINLLGIDSPGLSAAPAIAEYVVELLVEMGAPLEEKEDYRPHRPAIPCFRELSLTERESLIARDPRFGRIVCRCEMVTEGEVVAAIHSPIPARTLDALKRRVRVGAGRCQGAFDTPRLVAILSRELGLPPTAITKDGPGSELLTRRTKEWRIEDGEWDTDEH